MKSLLISLNNTIMSYFFRKTVNPSRKFMAFMWISQIGLLCYSWKIFLLYLLIVMIMQAIYVLTARQEIEEVMEQKIIQAIEVSKDMTAWEGFKAGFKSSLPKK